VIQADKSVTALAATPANSNRLPWLIAGVSLSALLIVLLFVGAYFLFTNDQQTQQASGTPSPSPPSVISQASVVPEVAASPSPVPTKQERPLATVAPLPSPRPVTFGNESTTAPRGDGYDSSRIYSGSEVSSKARILSKPEPQYTEEARKNQIVGTVVLRAVFTSSGQVSNLRAVSGLPFGLTERAIAAAREIKFDPATKDGRPVSMYIQLEYNFNLY
jgi:TonB family protein